MARAPVAQLVEQFPFKEEVGGSNPPGGTLILSTEGAFFIGVLTNLTEYAIV